MNEVEMNNEPFEERFENISNLQTNRISQLKLKKQKNSWHSCIKGENTIQNPFLGVTLVVFLGIIELAF
jgi:hypothetical protein